MPAGAVLVPAIAWFYPTEPVFVLPDLRDGVLLVALSIYAIVLAIALLNEQRDLEPTFYVGVALIVGIVFSHPWVAKRRSMVST